MNRLALFDCDGTLVDSQHSICTAMEAGFRAAGLPDPCRNRARRVVGLSLVEAMRVMLPEGTEAQHEELAEHYKAAFHRLRLEGSVREPLYEGIFQLLEALERDGWLLGVATGKSDRGLGHCLAGHGIGERFVTLQTADRHPSKPHPSMIETAMAEAGAAPHSTLMIGDTSYDMAMGRAAGAVAIGVAWGYHDPYELIAAGAHHVVEHPEEIVALARNMA